MEGFYKRLCEAQAEMKCKKAQYSSYGEFYYRSCEDILEAVKPICRKWGFALILSDEMVQIGERYYIKATAKIRDTESEESVEAQAYAREPETKKKMDDSQITGTASSYARKYALNGLFCIDDTKDADTEEYSEAGMQTVDNRQAADPETFPRIQKMVQSFSAFGVTETMLATYAGKPIHAFSADDLAALIKVYRAISGGEDKSAFFKAKN